MFKTRLKNLLFFILHYLDPRSTLLMLVGFGFGLAWGLYKLIFFLDLQVSKSVYWTAAIGLLGFLAVRFLETRSKRYNTLCGLEVELNQAMDALSLLISVLNNMVQCSMPLLMPQAPLVISLELVKEAGRIDVKNNLGDLLCDFRRINQDWLNLIEFGKEHEAAIKDPNHPGHQDVRKMGTQLLAIVLKRSKIALTLVENTLLLVRSYQKIDKPLVRFNQPYVSEGELLLLASNEKKLLAEEKQGKDA